MNKCLELPVSVYGILKAGAAFVPIDPTAPTDRIQFIVENCGIQLLVTNSSKKRQINALIERCEAVSTVIGLEIEGKESFAWDTVFKGSDALVDVELDEECLAYIMYTSGSTGCPKGLMHTHRSGLNYAIHSARLYDVGPSDVLGNHSPLHFDMSTFEFLTGPYCGSTTVLIPEDVTMFPVSLGQLIEAEKLTFWYSVPLALIQMINQGELEKRDLSSLRWVNFGGEPFPPKYLRSLMDLIPTARFSNVYGPAEVNQCTYYHVPNRSSLEDEAVPLGKVWEGAKGKVINEHDKEVQSGEVGELIICSKTMMLGYWRRDDLSERAFLRTATDSGNEEVYYRTGDLVRRNNSGELLFLGRRDRQIKMRGYRVELDEIENILSTHGDVEEAAVVAIANAEGESEIWAAVTVKSDGDIAGSDLRIFASGKLPAYCVPQRIETRDSFPRTTSGKIDRNSLRAEFLRERGV